MLRSENITLRARVDAQDALLPAKLFGRVPETEPAGLSELGKVADRIRGVERRRRGAGERRKSAAAGGRQRLAGASRACRAGP